MWIVISSQTSRKELAANWRPNKSLTWVVAMMMAAADVNPTDTGPEMKSKRKPVERCYFIKIWNINILLLISDNENSTITLKIHHKRSEMSYCSHLNYWDYANNFVHCWLLSILYSGNLTLVRLLPCNSEIRIANTFSSLPLFLIALYR